MSAIIQRCQSCGRQLFPFRLLCPSCGADAFETVPVETATVEQTTLLADGTFLATVVPRGGPALIARIDPDAAVGDDVSLSNDADASHSPPAAGTAYIPLPAAQHALQEIS